MTKVSTVTSAKRFNSASVSSPRRSSGSSGRVVGAQGQLQFGLGVVTEEIPPPVLQKRPRQCASIRPRCRHRGDRIPVRTVNPNVVLLQFGLGVVTEEIKPGQPAPERAARFNSASVSSPRRSSKATRRRLRNTGFNSASVSSPRRSGRAASSVIRRVSLQFGLGVVTEEIRPAVCRRGDLPGASIRPRCRHRGDGLRPGEHQRLEVRASIRPRCRHRGDDQGRTRTTTPRLRLQFGLGVVTEEIATGPLGLLAHLELQFGLGVVTEEIQTHEVWAFAGDGASIRPRCRHRGD